MELSTELISQFVKATKDDKKTKTVATVNGTAIVSNGKTYVKIDGSELLTPANTTGSIKTGERITVTIQDHTATITGNLTSPSVSSTDVKDMNSAISECETLIAGKVSTSDFDAQTARIDELHAENVSIKGHLDVSDARIDELETDNATINETLTANQASINKLETTKISTELADAKYATIENLEAANTDIYNLNATYADFKNTTTDKLTAVDASIAELNTGKLSATEAELKYANIDFSNIQMAAIEKLFTDSGIIEDLIVSDGKITGELVGVTIKGDLIEGNTVVAGKLVIKGEDGLYYKLNTDGVTTETEQTDYNSLNGTVIQAKSITAEKIAVDDLVAFGATIGGFSITEDALYSDVKAGPLNTTRGIYFDNTGQFSIGDSEQYLRYFKDTLGNYKLEISASSTVLTSADENVEEALATLKEDVAHALDSADTAQETADSAESMIKQLSDSISMLVTDGNGTSLMVQTDDGWTFSTAALQKTVDATSEELDSLVNEIGSTNNTVDVLQQAVDDLGILTDYITIGTYEDQPCIELGEMDSDFKLRITNTQVVYTEGSTVLAYFTNQSMHIKKAVIEEELRQGEFVWRVRSNGNMGLVWKGVSS